MAISPSALPAQAHLLSTRARPELLAGLAFLEGSASPSWGIKGLRNWFDIHLAAMGCRKPLLCISEPPAGTLDLRSDGYETRASHAVLPKVLTAARIRVLSTLRGLIATPPDDRFLAAAIFSGQVQRQRIGTVSRWALRLEEDASLSGIVLSLFVVDILSNREEYDRALCICDVCNRVSLRDGAFHRKSCPDHLPRMSGFTRRVSGERSFDDEDRDGSSFDEEEDGR